MKTLAEALATSRAAISTDDVRGWFKNCGYVAQPN